MTKTSLIPQAMKLLDLSYNTAPLSPSTVLTQDAMDQREVIADLETEKSFLSAEEFAKREKELNAKIETESALMESLMEKKRARSEFTVSNFEEFEFLQGCTGAEVNVKIRFGTPKEVQERILASKEDGMIVTMETAPAAASPQV